MGSTVNIDTSGSLNDSIIYSFGAKSQFSYVYDNRGRVHTFGNNDNGQLGLGSGTTQFSSPQLVTLPLKNTITQIDGATDAITAFSSKIFEIFKKHSKCAQMVFILLIVFVIIWMK